MPHCSHCDHFISADYARVLGINGTVDVCPYCPDRVRRGGFAQDARTNRYGGHGIDPTKSNRRVTLEELTGRGDD